jgi:hypothetical protein
VSSISPDEDDPGIDPAKLQEHKQSEGERALRTTIKHTRLHLSAQRIREIVEEETA